jgi:ketosteroid isomerase-like protein
MWPKLKRPFAPLTLNGWLQPRRETPKKRLLIGPTMPQFLPPNAPPITGKQAIRRYVAGVFASPDFSISWNTDKVIVSSSGDMAYSTGSDQFTFRTPDNKLVTEHTNGIVVWKKQPDGSWKAAIDIWNADARPNHSFKRCT